METYTSLLSRLSVGFDLPCFEWDDEYTHMQFELVSASLFNYLPEIACERHEPIFRNILLHKKMSKLEQSELSVLDAVEEGNGYGEMVQLLRKKAAVICTFHLGSYRLLNLMLIRDHVPFSLVIGKQVLETEGESFKEIFHAANGKAEFGLIDAEDPASGIRMFRELRKGRSLVLYIDGNTGSGADTSKNENNCIIDFLGQQIYARKGISWLAHAAGVPIMIAISLRKRWECISTQFFGPIWPKQKDRREFAEVTTQMIYDLAAPFIRQYPEQWEAWLYLHKTARVIRLNHHSSDVKKRQNDGENTLFNSRLFGKFKINGTAFLLQKHGYQFFEIDPNLYEALQACTGRPVAKEIFGDDLFEQLWQNSVLTFPPG